MGLNSIGKIFMPKNKVFYDLFENVADTVEEMGKVLQKVVSEPDYDKRAPIIKLLEDLEHKNDETSHQIFT